MIKLLLAILTIALIWLYGSPHIASLMDRFYTVPVAVLPLERLELQRGKFIVGPRSWAMPESVQFALDSQNQLKITSAGGTFTFGPVTRCSTDAVDPFYEFLPGVGDQVSFVKSHSVLSWPTPYFSVMNVARATWGRHSYFTLLWRKPTGASIKLIWPDEQGYYATVGWTDGNMYLPPQIKIN